MGLLADASPFRVEQDQRSEAIRINSLKNSTPLCVIRVGTWMRNVREADKEKAAAEDESLVIDEDALLNYFVW